MKPSPTKRHHNVISLGIKVDAVISDKTYSSHTLRKQFLFAKTVNNIVVINLSYFRCTVNTLKDKQKHEVFIGFLSHGFGGSGFRNGRYEHIEFILIPFFLLICSNLERYYCTILIKQITLLYCPRRCQCR